MPLTVPMPDPLPACSRLLTLCVLVAACTREDLPPGPDTPAETDTPGPTDPPLDSDTDPEPAGPVQITAHPAPGCADPALRDAAPYRLHSPAGDWSTQAYDPASASLFVGGGLAVADLTGDGLLDLLLTAYDAQVALYAGRADLGFDLRDDLLPPLPERSSGATAVDFDGDGDLDLMLTVFRGHDVLLRNDDGAFVDVAAELGVRGAATGRTMSSSWADIDRDGDLDAFVAGYGRLSTPEGGLPPGDPSHVYFQQADGSFVDAVEQLSDPHPLRGAHSFVGGFTDVNDDGRPDLFLVNDFGWTFPTLLLHNRDGALVWEGESGVELRWENMGLGIGDLNGDLVPDFLVGAWDHLGLLVSRDGTWFESSELLGVRSDHDRGQRVAWGTELADVDNDGDLDAAVAYGFLDVRSNNVNPHLQPDALFVQGADGRFADRAAAWGVADEGLGRGFVFADLNRDGWLDLIKRDLIGPTRVYLAQCGDGAWLGVHLRQPGANRFAIGARVIARAGERQWVRELRAGGTSYGSGGPPELHFGFGDLAALDELEIRWPDGEVDRLSDVPLDRYLTLTRAP
jgi:hypothetical protein